jgi:hypothetical protein
MKVEFRNRYNEVITFDRIEENKFIMSGGSYYRFGWDSEEDVKNKRFTFANPSGGPYVSEGMTMGYIHPNWIRKIVQYITVMEGTEDLLIVTYPESIVKANVNKQDVFRVYSPEGRIIESLPSFNDAVKWLEDKYGKDL